MSDKHYYENTKKTPESFRFNYSSSDILLFDNLYKNVLFSANHPSVTSLVLFGIIFFYQKYRVYKITLYDINRNSFSTVNLFSLLYFKVKMQVIFRSKISIIYFLRVRYF